MEPVEDEYGIVPELFVVDMLNLEDGCEKRRWMFASREQAATFGAKLLDVDGVEWVRVGNIVSNAIPFNNDLTSRESQG